MAKDLLWFTKVARSGRAGTGPEHHRRELTLLGATPVQEQLRAARGNMPDL